MRWALGLNIDDRPWNVIDHITHDMVTRLGWTGRIHDERVAAHKIACRVVDQAMKGETQDGGGTC